MNAYSAVVPSVLLAACGGFAFPSSVVGQGATEVDWDPPRTAAGHPDLQGNWTNATLTPLERPPGQERVLTPEQAELIEAGRAEEAAQVEQTSDPDRPPPEAGGTFAVCIDSATGCYNEVYRDPGERVAVVGGEPRSSLVTRPADGRVPPITEEARLWREEQRELVSRFGAFDHPELRPIGERCLMSFGSNAGPPMLPNYWYNNNYSIVQTPDHVVITAEMVHDTRVIHLGDVEPLPDHIRPWMGDSRGRWEGDTLVVETTNFHPLQRYRGNPSDDLTVTERFARVDEETILYEFTVDDPTVYTETWGGEVPLERLDGQLYEYACHEGNYSLENVLRGARYEEAQEAGAASEPPTAPR